MKTAAIRGAVGSARKIEISASCPPIAIATGSIHLLRFADGRRAPIHLLDGLPKRLALRRGRFYTREQAAMAMMRDSAMRSRQ